jgi:DNA-binding NarL/FixJ family response regulator
MAERSSSLLRFAELGFATSLAKIKQEENCVSPHAHVSEETTSFLKLRSADEQQVNGLLPEQQETILTPREREVLILLAEGKTVPAAATVLGVSRKTVDVHKFNLMRKLDVHNRAQLVMWAIRARVVKIPPSL